jgi:surface protein
MLGSASVANAFDQNIGGWDVSNVTNMSNMFNSALVFNNGGSDAIQSWTAHNCTNFSSMFSTAYNFNQPLPNLVNTSTVSTCALNSMFNDAILFNQNIGGWDVSNVTNMSYMFYTVNQYSQFNNGELGVQSISGLNPTGATYTDSTKTIVCPVAAFLTTLTPGNVLIIKTPTIMYSSAIQSITNNTTLILTTAFDYELTGIIDIQKQIPGTSPLYWNTARVTATTNMFYGAALFNQNITTNGNIWKTALVINAVSMFQGGAFTSTSISVFNNGELITGTTAPMGWNLTAANTSQFRTFCRLTSSNKPASVT